MSAAGAAADAALAGLGKPSGFPLRGSERNKDGVAAVNRRGRP